MTDGKTASRIQAAERQRRRRAKLRKIGLSTRGRPLNKQHEHLEDTRAAIRLLEVLGLV